MLLLDYILKFYFQLFLTSFQSIIAITKFFLSIINLSFDFRVDCSMTVVMYILFYMYCLLLYL